MRWKSSISEVNETNMPISALRFRIRFLENILASCRVENVRRGIKWKYRSHENHDFRDCSRKEVGSFIFIDLPVHMVDFIQHVNAGPPARV